MDELSHVALEPVNEAGRPTHPPAQDPVKMTVSAITAIHTSLSQSETDQRWEHPEIKCNSSLFILFFLLLFKLTLAWHYMPCGFQISLVNIPYQLSCSNILRRLKPLIINIHF